MKYKLNVKLGIAPINWCNDDMPEIGNHIPFEQIVSEMALAGFKGTEIGNKYPKNPKVLLRHLKLRRLCVTSAWFSSYILEQDIKQVLIDFEKHVLYLKALNAPYVCVSEQSRSIQQLDLPLFENKPVLNENEWEILGNGLNELGKIAKKHGLILVYHHHMGTVVQTAVETRQLLNSTDPNLVSLLFDTGHFKMSNENVGQLILEFQDRIKYVHLKNVRQDVVAKMKQEGMAFLQGVILGMFDIPHEHGLVNFDEVFANLEKINYQGWMIVEAEQHPLLANPLLNALRAHLFIDSKVEVIHEKKS